MKVELRTATVMPTAEDILEKKVNATSVVWKWFGYLRSDEEQNNPVCKLCRRSVPSKAGNTTNLFNHLNRHHPSDHTESLTMRAQVSPAPHTAAA